MVILDTIDINSLPSRDEARNAILGELFVGFGSALLTGQGGVGKSHLIRSIMNEYKCIVLSTTGISASLINGQTVHSFFRLGFSKNIEELKKNDKVACNKFNIPLEGLLSRLYKTVEAAQILIIDEVSMLGVDTFKMIHYRLQQLNLRIPIIYSGDFLQLPPVKQDSLLTDSFFRSVPVINLNKVYRASDPDLLDYLNKIRVGKIDQSVSQFTLDLHPKKKPLSGDPIQLVATNKEADNINFTKFASLESPIVSFNAEVIPGSKSPTKTQLKTFYSDNKISPILDLRVGARVMITRNLIIDSEDGSESIYNGDSGIVTDIDDVDGVISIEFDRLSKTLPIEMLDFKKEEFSTDDAGLLTKSVLWSVRQFPLIQAWAITMHKSQGSSIDSLLIHSGAVFAESQLYVALSRATNHERLWLNFDYSRHGLAEVLKRITNVNKVAKSFYESLPIECQYQ